MHNEEEIDVIHPNITTRINRLRRLTPEEENALRQKKETQEKYEHEIYGQGNPLVLIHGGGSTIQTNFEKIIPLIFGTGT